MSKKKPNGYWTLNRCKEYALKHESRSEWALGQDAASYQAAQRNGWIEKCCSHMAQMKKPRGYWTLDRCKEDALKYGSRSEWAVGDSTGYPTAQINGWIEECCCHMGGRKSPTGIKVYWTIERCIESALKHETRKEWKLAEISAHGSAQKNGWLAECTRHMTSFRKPSGYWTLERCKESAMQYQTTQEWRNGENGAYDRASREKWIGECCAHMEQPRVPLGYWTLERCVDSALEYTNYGDWMAAFRGAYGAARRNGWLDECRAHMVLKARPGGYWTKERCIQDARKYKYRSEWKKNNSSSSSIAFRNGWEGECCAHMDWLSHRNYWTIERCKESASKYNTRLDWKYGDTNAYAAAQDHGWLDDCTHIECGKKSDNACDGYIKTLIAKGISIKKDEIPPELIELKREQLKLHRLIKEVTQ